MNWDLTFHAVEIVVLLFGVAVPIVRSSSRVANVLRDYPPHKHHPGGIISYPPGYAPGKTEKIE